MTTPRHRRTDRGRGMVASALAASAVAALALSAGPAQAMDGATPVGAPPVVNALGDLADGWGDHVACSVEGDRPVVCFDSEVEMLAASFVAARGSQCASWLRLYEHPGYGGRVLQFRDVGVWQDLAWYGFDDQTSSWRSGACGVTFADGAGGASSRIHGGAWWEVTSTTVWDDRISSLRIG